MDIRQFRYEFGSVRYDLGARTHIMGIVNVTPDSFSDGGQFLRAGAAVDRGLELEQEGADFIDVGGESTRPGSDPVPEPVELERVIPVIRELAKRTRIPISVDTVKPEVARQALESGAVIVNDISGLRDHPGLARVAAAAGASIILMHKRGSPKTMQDHPSYEDVVEEICDELQPGVDAATAAGISQIFVDPGIGFGKDLRHNLAILRRLAEFRRLGYPVLVGPSRKSFIGKILDAGVDDRMEGTAAAVAVAVMNGANVVRVHDVRQMMRVSRMVDAILGRVATATG